MADPLDSPPVFLTGASGFIGGKLAERLLAEGRRVRLLVRRPLPRLEALGAEIILGDLLDPATLARGCAGAATVFHVAGRVGVWGPADDFFRVNVEGTRQLLTAARAAGVPHFVFTSSPSVVYNGGSLSGVDESAPLCTAAPSPYPLTKALAEHEVLAANTAAFSTVALRPHLVVGPGDQNLIPRVIARARARKLRIIGPGRNRVDVTSIDNVVDAHLLAERALANPPPARSTTTPAIVRPPTNPPAPMPAPIQAGSANPRLPTRPPLTISPSAPAGTAAAGTAPPINRARSAAGRAYFITNGDPVVLWDWINELLRGIGVREVTSRVSLDMALLGGRALETWWRVFKCAGDPPMTRFIAKELCTEHWFDISAARRDLGYNPRVSMAQVTAELIALHRQR